MGKQFIFAKGTASFKMGLVTAGVIRSQNRALWHLSSLAESGRIEQPKKVDQDRK